MLQSYTTVCSENCIVKCPNHLLQKLHIQNKPNCNFLFLKNKLGKSVSFCCLNSGSQSIVNRLCNLFLNAFSLRKQIWRENEANDFTTFDTKISTRYDPLCDPYLRKFFKRKANLNVNFGICIANQLITASFETFLTSIFARTKSSTRITRWFVRWRNSTIIVDLYIVWGWKRTRLRGRRKMLLIWT